MAVRRGRTDLVDTLRAYRAHHAARARSVTWGAGELSTIVVPCFRHAEYLEATVESIAAQDWRPLEVVFVDDASPDATADVLKRVAGRFGEGIDAKVVRRRRNHGQASAINLGVLSSRGSVVTVLNDDDCLMEGAVSTIRAILDRHRAYLFGATCVVFKGDVPTGPRLPPVSDIPVSAMSPEDVFDHQESLKVTHSGSTFLRSAWTAVRGYRPRRVRIVEASERDFHLRIASLFPVVTARETPFSCWRSDSSVDSGLLS